jgi:hypothetical protein
MANDDLCDLVEEIEDLTTNERLAITTMLTAIQVLDRPKARNVEDGVRSLLLRIVDAPITIEAHLEK